MTWCLISVNSESEPVKGIAEDRVITHICFVLNVTITNTTQCYQACRVYPIKYAHGFIVPLLWLYHPILVNPCNWLNHIRSPWSWSCDCLRGNEVTMEDMYKIKPWWRHQMETFSALLALYAGNSLGTGEFSAQRPVTQSFDVFFDLRLNKRLSTKIVRLVIWGAIAPIMTSL